MASETECFLDEDLVEIDGKRLPGIVVTCTMCEQCVSMQGSKTEENVEKLLCRLRKECPEQLRHRFTIIEE